MRLNVVVVSTCLLLTACGASPSAETESAQLTVSPLDEFFSGTGDRQKSVRSWQYRTQELIVQCMAQSGFEFVASLQPLPELLVQRDLLDQDEWTARYGYGITTSIDAALSARAEDPNTRILSALATTERDAYMSALIGPALASGAPLTSTPPLEDQGCSGRAVLDTGGTVVTDNLGPYDQDYAERMAQVRARPDVQEAVSGWSRCMAEEGYSFADQDMILNELNGRLAEVLLPYEASLADAGTEELTRVFDGIESGTLQIEGLSELQSYERAVAVHDLACFELHVKDMLDPLRFAVEADLIEKHQDRLNEAREMFADD